MSFYSIRPEIPSIITPFDPEVEEAFSSTHTTGEAPTGTQEATPRETVLESKSVREQVDTATSAAIQDLQSLIPSARLLRPFVDDDYEVFTNIGNLLYARMTPAAVAVPQTVKDAAGIVNFARERGIQLTVKGGGHSYAGYCLNHGGIVLDMSGLKRVVINDDNTVTIQAGCLWSEVYEKLNRNHAADMIVGGQCPSVGVAGFTLGGGLSPFSRSYGLGIDNVIEMTIITASGELVTVSDQDTDPVKRNLFWALRGGGGGNFGVLVEFKSRVHQLRDPFGRVVCGQLSWELPRQESEFEEMMKVFNTTTWPNELTIDAIWRYNDKNQLTGDLTVIYNGDMDACSQVIKPLLEFNPTNKLEEMVWQRWVIKEQGFDSKSLVYHHHASFIFGQGGITPAVTKAIISLMKESFALLNGQGKSHVLWDHIGGETAEVPSDHTPFFWRQGVYVSNFKLQWNQPEMKPKMLAFIDKVKKTLLPHALGGKAAYLNYIDRTVQNWQEAYYGDNYRRLQQVKSQWDPANFFHFPQSIEPERPKNHFAGAKDVAVASNGARGTMDGSLALLNGSTALSPFLGHMPSHISAAVSNQAPARHVPEGPTAIQRTSEVWDKYSLPNPDSLWSLEEPTDEVVWNIIGAERLKMMISAAEK